MQNQRKYERYNLALSAYLKDKSGVRPMKTGNISRYGLFLITNEPAPMRQLLKLIIEFPHNRETIEVLAQVMWSDVKGEGREGIPGMGVKFFSLPDAERQKWEHFVDTVRSGSQSAGADQAAKAAAKDGDGESTGVYTINEEQLEELEELEELSDLELEEGELVNIDEDVEEETFDGKPQPIQDLSEVMEEYEHKDPDLQAEEPETDEVERRIYPRKPVAFLVRLKDVSRMREMFTRDISLGGMFLKTNDQKGQGDVVEVIIVHPWTLEEFPLRAEVRRVERNAAGNVAGLGVQFLEFDDDMRDSLLTYIESGYMILKSSPDTPIEAEVIRRIEAIETKIKANPIASDLHYQVGLLYLCLSDWEKSGEHVDIARKLGYSVPEEVMGRLEGKA